MKLIFGLLKWLVLAAVVLLGIGFFLPSKFETTREITINASPEKIQALVDAPKAWLLWSPWNRRDPNMKITYSGAERGVGAKWVWVSKTEGNGGMDITQVDPGKRVSYSLRMDDMNPSTGELSFAPTQGSTQVRWRMAGEMGGNPIHRWFALMMDRLIGPDFEAGLKSLKALAEKP